MYVEQLLPAEPDDARPIVLVHGGGGQGTDWLAGADGRPGWAELIVATGRSVHVVDRPGFGRSPGRLPAQGVVPMTARLFASGDQDGHTQWPGPGGPDDPLVRALAAAASGLAADLAAAQETEFRLMTGVLERIGPAVLITHSLGACAGWLVAWRRPDLVAAVVALEPPPPFLAVPGTPLDLAHGLTATPLGERVPAQIPIAVVEAEASAMAAGCRAVSAALSEAGLPAEHIRLADHGVHGNGHGLMLERNHDAVLDVVLNWLFAASNRTETGERR